jgi:hypothetical protein
VHGPRESTSCFSSVAYEQNEGECDHSPITRLGSDELILGIPSYSLNVIRVFSDTMKRLSYTIFEDLCVSRQLDANGRRGLKLTGSNIVNRRGVIDTSC